ncbi:MAG: hypothetical protein KAX44_07275 [Candidatus Brocadiae bacterium]|nr:hypothetical protein [Candidatus Brocadiia bacterium]
MQNLYPRVRIPSPPPHPRPLVKVVPKTGINSIAFSPDGLSLASASSASYDGTVKFWNPGDGSLQMELHAFRE